MTYVPLADEEQLFAIAYERKTPLLLLGPTGCGKTQLVQHMAERLGRQLLTVSCHDDMTTADLVGRHLIRGNDVTWQDGPLTFAMRSGAIVYLDEIVEARSDTLAVVHSVTDHRRTIYIDRLNHAIEARDGFLLVASYNPRPAGSPKELKPSLRQRFVTLRMDYLPPAQEAAVVAARSGVAEADAASLVQVASALRDAARRDPQRRFEPPSTRTLIQAAELIAGGAPTARAVDAAIIAPLTNDPAVETALRELAAAANTR